MIFSNERVKIKYKKEIIYFGRQNAHYSQLCTFQNFPFSGRKLNLNQLLKFFLYEFTFAF